MAQTHAYLQLDPQRLPEQTAFLESRVDVRRSSGCHVWVVMDDSQLGAFASVGILVTQVPHAETLSLGCLTYQPAKESPQVPPHLRAKVPVDDESSFWIVHCIAPMDRSWLQTIVQLGANLMHPLDACTTIFQMSLPVSEQVRLLTFVDAVGLFHPAYVIDLSLTSRTTPCTADSLIDLTLQMPPQAPEGNVVVRCFNHINPTPLAQAFEQAGATVVNEIPNGFILDVPASKAAAVFSVPGVLSAGIRYEITTSNFIAGIISGVNYIRNRTSNDFLINLNGQGEIISVLDTGCDTGNLGAGLHPDLSHAVREIYNTQAPGSPMPDTSSGGLGHGTHVIGTIVGDGTTVAGIPTSAEATPQPIVGMAPEAALLAMGPLPSPNNYLSSFEYAYGKGASIFSNSWAICPQLNIPITSNYNIYSPIHTMPIDQWCFSHPDAVVVFAAGNNEADLDNDGKLDGRYLNTMALAKNILCIGASENIRTNKKAKTYYTKSCNNQFGKVARASNDLISDQADQIALFSARGIVNGSTMTDLRRVRPDLVAPGTNILSTRSTQNTKDKPTNLPPNVPATHYAMLSGTSMATPVVSGCCALLRQYVRKYHDQMGRPLLLFGTPLLQTKPGSLPPLTPAFPCLPCLLPQPNGALALWISPGTATSPSELMASRISHDFINLDPRPTRLHKGTMVECKAIASGPDAHVVCREANGRAWLMGIDSACHPRLLFGIQGRIELGITPAPINGLISTTDHLFVLIGGILQGFHQLSGMPEAPITLTIPPDARFGPHATMAWDGQRLTICWAVPHLQRWHLRCQQLEVQENPIISQPLELLEQDAEIVDPHILWNPTTQQLVITWCDSDHAGLASIRHITLNPDGSRLFQSLAWSSSDSTIRRPLLVNHSTSEYLLLWEEKSQPLHAIGPAISRSGSYDTYCMPININLFTPTTSHYKPTRFSDTPLDTQGFTATYLGDYFIALHQSPNETNGNILGVYATALTPQGKFLSQNNPGTPLQRSGQYVTNEFQPNQISSSQPATFSPILATLWTGEHYFLFSNQNLPNPLLPSASHVPHHLWARLSADGTPDMQFKGNGRLTIPAQAIPQHCILKSTPGNLVISLVQTSTGAIHLQSFDPQGTLTSTFGTGGQVLLSDSNLYCSSTIPQLLNQPGNHAGIAVIYQGSSPKHPTLRFQHLDMNGSIKIPPIDLVVDAEGSASPWSAVDSIRSRFLILYSRTNGGNKQLCARLFHFNGTPDTSPEFHITPPSGEALNGSLGRRPESATPACMHYGAVWQYRANPNDPWEIHFGHLDHNGAPLPLQHTSPGHTTVCLIGKQTQNWPIGHQALLPQLVSTFTHELCLPQNTSAAASASPSWDPSYGLAFIGEDPQGKRTLYITAIDAHGHHLHAPAPPPPTGPFQPPAPVGILSLSDSAWQADRFQLLWNGRLFFIAWTESQGNAIRHRYTFVNRHINRAVHDLPSAALIRALAVNGATNLDKTNLPNVEQGYGWGLINLRQSLAPTPPVTLFLRDDCAIRFGGVIQYRFPLPPGTRLLKVILNWTDPPGERLLAPMHLKVIAPVSAGANKGLEYYGNCWQQAPVGPTPSPASFPHLSRPITQTDTHEDFQTFKQVVLENPPPGIYVVEISASLSNAAYFLSDLLPFALVFAGSGPEARFSVPSSSLGTQPVY